MKLKPIYIILVLGFILFESQSLYAQESPVYPDNMENERAQQYPAPGTGDLKTLSNTRGSTLSDSSYVNAQNEALKEAEKNEAKKEEDVLSFNFLYYIIQKFKMSDIVEK